MDRKLSTGGVSPSGKRKKREAEKRSAPLTPLREKGKGKEQDRVSCETCSKTARAHVRRKLPCACSFSEAGEAAAEIVGNCDRVLVMHEGRIAGEVSGAGVTETAIVRLAHGLPPADASSSHDESPNPPSPCTT